ncbi:MAG: zf-TFIIB domain-containing protein [Terrimicrobiaceae bacterium]|nr:zf-TFIIB domain-containing protein [Terrimicrobiaceae bacterium]
MKCPRDQEELVTQVYEGHGRFHVEICPKCHGIWFDAGELNLVLPELTIRLENMKWKPAPESHAKVVSPKTGALCDALQLDVADGLIVDRDPVSGGHWIDGDELDHLKQFAQTACAETREHVDFIARQMEEMGFHH